MLPSFYSSRFYRVSISFTFVAHFNVHLFSYCKLLLTGNKYKLQYQMQFRLVLNGEQRRWRLNRF